jgi:beta-N-acetylhexosaminidase
VDLARKIGQLFVVAAHDDIERHVREDHVGGVIWLQSTIEKTTRLNAELQRIAEVPLLISADLEAGMGMRFIDGAWWPPAMAIAATGDVHLAEEQGRATAREALAIGVNHILAPVADVNVDPRNPVINTRSFGEDPDDVARYVTAFVNGVQAEGCIATAKHFPGHGDTYIDSHRALPLLDVTRERLERVELVPFRAAIAAGVRSVMIGHLAVPAVDASLAPVRTSFENVYGTTSSEVPHHTTMPATLSRPVIDLLRHDLGFDGLVMTDAMDMGALAAHFDPGEAAVRAIEAGVDQILFPYDTDASIHAVKEAVRSGRITEARIDESVKRVLAAKRFVGRVTAQRRPLIAPQVVAEQSITLVRDRHALLPLRGRSFAVLVVNPHGDSLEAALRELVSTTESLDAADVVVLLLALRPKSGAGEIVVPPEVQRIAEQHVRKTIAIALGSPYVLRDLGEVSTFVCAWGVQPLLQIAAVRAIRGELEMRGRLPVRIE